MWGPYGCSNDNPSTILNVYFWLKVEIYQIVLVHIEHGLQITTFWLMTLHYYLLDVHNV